MATTIDYSRDRENPSATIFHGMNDYGAEASDYQTTMDENPSATIDYDGLARGKLCPLKANQPPVPGVWYLDPAPDLTEMLKTGAIKCRADGEPPRVEYIGGQCDGPRCAWYDQTAERCAVLSISRNK